ncbi:MAG: hypothetical protein ACK4YQ_12970 [Phenylobacterium sp.]|uniref:hypothetical protein n=1 Tax=Phenylobacterium sp. TaxID=1871053 RepID=UPI00391A0F2D
MADEGWEAAMAKSQALGLALAGAGAGVLLAGAAWAAGAGEDMDWLAICARCITPTIQSKSGVGTANATATARVTRADAEAWCANWQPGDRGCVAAQLASDEAKTLYRASADCTRGRITPVDGQTYTLAGVWDDSDIGGGRTRWRDASGRIVGRDNASGGLGISQQWEVLCPGPLKVSAPPPSAAAAPAGAVYAVGQSVQALYMGGWVPARVTRIYPARAGGQVEYDVALANGKRGIVPARMLRPAP